MRPILNTTNGLGAMKASFSMPLLAAFASAAFWLCGCKPSSNEEMRIAFTRNVLVRFLSELYPPKDP